MIWRQKDTWMRCRAKKRWRDREHCWNAARITPTHLPAPTLSLLPWRPLILSSSPLLLFTVWALCSSFIRPTAPFCFFPLPCESCFRSFGFGGVSWSVKTRDRKRGRKRRRTRNRKRDHVWLYLNTLSDVRSYLDCDRCSHESQVLQMESLSSPFNTII